MVEQIGTHSINRPPLKDVFFIRFECNTRHSDKNKILSLRTILHPNFFWINFNNYKTDIDCLMYKYLREKKRILSVRNSALLQSLLVLTYFIKSKKKRRNHTDSENKLLIGTGRQQRDRSQQPTRFTIIYARGPELGQVYFTSI